MRWNELEKEWQKVFELCWEAFCGGNLPIAAIITDMEGNILSTGKNNYLISEKFLNPKVDHAETECMQMLDIVKYPKLHDYILYTSMEPCPMCMGTIVMGNIRKVRIATRDACAGSTDICLKNSYIASKNIDIRFMDDSYGNISMALQAYAELRRSKENNWVLDKFEADYPEAVFTARSLFSERVLEKFIEQKKSFEEIFNHINSIIEATLAI